VTYCTQPDLQTRFGEEELIQLTDRENNNSVIAAVVDQAIADAASIIEGYVLAAGYTLPLLNVPDILRSYACDIARYRLYDDHAHEQVVKRYEDAITYLKSLAKGDVSIGPKTANSDDSSAGEVIFENDSNQTIKRGF